MTAGDLVLAFVAFAASMLTFFSGFGLGTLLLAFMLLYFPPEIAIGITAIVHLVNNIFKYLLTRNHIDTRLVLTFGLPAILGALLGAFLLQYLNQLDPLYQYEWAGKLHFVTVIKIVVGLVMVLFVIWEWIPGFQKIQFDVNLLRVGGLITGFFGGLSGHQGALRSAFLSKGDLDKETFIATGVAIACIIDLSRIQYYARHFHTLTLKNHQLLIFLCIFAAITGSIMGNLWLKKVTEKFVQTTVAIMVLIMATLLVTGIL
jgi:uncharacterized membrane protein YfcA